VQRIRGRRDGLAASTRYLHEVLSSGSHDHETLWLALLKVYTSALNTHGQFDDIISDSRLAITDTNSIENVLAEASVAEMSVLYEFLLAHDDMSEKRTNGQFFTPDDVAMFMASKSRQFGTGIWIDPCCGVGNLSYWLVKQQRRPEAFLLNNMKFVDLDDLALFSARVIMATRFQKKESSLFSKLEPNFIQGDFLRMDEQARDENGLSYDFVIMNPPYVQTSSRGLGFGSHESRDMYAFFLERAFKSSRGVIAITPQTFTNGARHRSLRSIILNESKECSIYCFDNVPDTIFRGFKYGSENSNTVNSTRAAITVASTANESAVGCKDFLITPLVRWPSRDRALMFCRVDEMLGRPVTVEADLFPKVPKGLEDLYDELCETPVRLCDVVIKHGEGEHFNVPTTPRYFISAAKRDLSRSSMARLTVGDRRMAKLAYLTLNSSLAYFWWRVRDGGMTLSRATLLSTPLLTGVNVDTRTASRLIQRLEESESSNLVIKLNSGKGNENIKHSRELIHDINRLLVPAYADALLQLHSNSSLADSV